MSDHQFLYKDDLALYKNTCTGHMYFLLEQYNIDGRMYVMGIVCCHLRLSENRIYPV